MQKICFRVQCECRVGIGLFGGCAWTLLPPYVRMWCDFMDSMFQSPLMLLKSGSMPSIGSGYDEEIAPTFDTTKASASKCCLCVAGAPAPCACRLASRRSAGVEELFKQLLGKWRNGLPAHLCSALHHSTRHGLCTWTGKKLSKSPTKTSWQKSPSRWFKGRRKRARCT